MMSKKNHPYFDESMWKGASASVFSNAKSLSENMTAAEIKLWDFLKEKIFKGIKFRRQHPISKYIADFYCHKYKLIIELAGKYHLGVEQKIIDAERSSDLLFQGIKIVRFTNEEVMNDIDSVLIEIGKQLKI